MSELLGKETIDTNTYGKSTGRNGNYSTNYQNAGRELFIPDEVRMLDNRYAILFIRGERPVMDEKFDVLQHSNVGGTTDGQGKPYDHGEDCRSVGKIQIIGSKTAGQKTEPEAVLQSDYVLYSETDLEDIFYYEKENEVDEKHGKSNKSLNPQTKKSKPADENSVYPIRRVER